MRVAAAAVAVSAVLLTPVPARAANVCESPEPKNPVTKGVPIEDQMYAPKRLAPLATGAGVRVAVIDSGVDADHAQLGDKVDKGADFLHNDNSGRQDCVGHGTAVASLIAAGPSQDTGFQGLAPDATIVPIRISEQQEIDGEAVGERGTPKQFADAIDFAVEQADADVINLSLVMTTDNTDVKRAVQRAVDAGVIVVAAAGNNATAEGGNPVPFPASYDGVIGVGATTAEGTRATYSQHGKYVDIAAVGDNVTVAWRGTGHAVVQGTSFAAPFVSATVALIKQRFPDATPDEIFRRLTATADPAPGGDKSDDYGYGLLNPYRALTESLGPATRAPRPPAVMSGNDPEAAALAARRARSEERAMLFGAIGMVAALLLGVVALIMRRGRQRGWRPATPDPQ
ncbi:type VII secretion-associated serine protease mycosin [Paractinoplanes rishiriensis]|uniref:type VII secretion-associated serine protease mycosin n=1 Tax=Paractinoplanes rishiriensis TaxID=1050105 RepID=UPI003F694A02